MAKGGVERGEGCAFYTQRGAGKSAQCALYRCKNISPRTDSPPRLGGRSPSGRLLQVLLVQELQHLATQVVIGRVLG